MLPGLVGYRCALVSLAAMATCVCCGGRSERDAAADSVVPGSATAFADPVPITL
jgi:hypothetical protein